MPLRGLFFLCVVFFFFSDEVIFAYSGVYSGKRGEKKA